VMVSLGLVKQWLFILLNTSKLERLRICRELYETLIYTTLDNALPCCGFAISCWSTSIASLPIGLSWVRTTDGRVGRSFFGVRRQSAAVSTMCEYLPHEYSYKSTLWFRRIQRTWCMECSHDHGDGDLEC
jgi:hypothetical protein